MIIFDASTLILLAKIELLRTVLEDTEASIPPTVKKESTRKRELWDAKLISQVIKEGLIKVKEWEKGSKEAEGKQKPTKIVEKLMKDFNIAEGEAQALHLTRENDALLATDDGPPIKACKVLDVSFSTALNFLIRALAHRLIEPEIGVAKLKKLEHYGRYGPEIIEHATKKVKNIGGDLSGEESNESSHG